MNRSSLLHLLPRLFLIAIMTAAILPAVYTQNKRAMEIEDLFRIRRVSDPQLSPDGKNVAYVVTVIDKAENRSNSDIWIVPAAGGEARKLTDSPKQDRHPRWSPDGRSIAFESNRDGSFQIYIVNADGGGTRQLTSISTEASTALWSPDEKTMAFVSSVFPEFSDKPYRESNELNRKKQDDRDNGKVKARIITKLLYRHWDSWVDDKRQHIFVIPSAGGDPRDITPGDRDAIPPSSTFSGGDDYAFSPDGKEIAYTATPVPVREESWSTNHDIYTVDLASGERKQITANPAADIFPRYSPDGRYIAYRAQARPGFEADRWQIILYDRSTGIRKSLTEKFDAGVNNILWSTDSRLLYFTAEDKAEEPVYCVSTGGNDVKKIIDGEVNGDINVTGDGRTFVFTRQSMMRPVEIYTAASENSVGPAGTPRSLTGVNDALFANIAYTKPEMVWFTGAKKTKVQMWIVKPPFFDAKKKYPLVFIVHGGPQGAWLNSWSYRWNPMLWAAQDYVLALPNPRGSTGFGQKFVDEISRDWGGKVYEDLMNGLTVLEKLPYINKDRMAAAGASYGGYMMNWFQGHTNKFKTLITHCGVYNFYSMYGATEETWFDEWEHGIPWVTSDFDKFSPHKYAKNFRTPNLIIHNEYDDRIPYTEGFSLFTTLQRKGIPSKLLYFPDEGHFVLKPQNSELWHKTIFEWLEEYLKK